jgi:predicted esterase
MTIHANGQVLSYGAELGQARAAVILLHGRGGSAIDILTLASELGREDEVAYIAPEAVGNTWYPLRFLEPRSANEPHLSSALAKVDSIVQTVLAAGLKSEQLLLGGFSQGACLALDYVARHPRRYGGVLAYSGGLIGATVRPEDYAAELAGTPIFVGCSDIDPHIPLGRVQQTSQIMGQLGGAVTERIYARMGHSINADEIALGREWVAHL